MLKGIFIGVISCVLVSTLFINAGCKKQIQDKPISAEMLSWFNYKAYSYWIMKDSVTGDLDSIFCNGTQTIYYIVDKKYRYFSKTILFIEFKLDGTYYGGSFNLIMASKENNDVSLLAYGTAAAKSQVWYDPFLNIPYESSGSSTSYRAQNLTVNYFPSLIINNQAFDSVYDLQYTFPNSPAVEHWFINRKAGFLKIVQDNSLVKRTMLLQSWNISFQ